MDSDGPMRTCEREEECGHEAPEKFGREVDGEGWLCLVCLDWWEEQNGIK